MADCVEIVIELGKKKSAAYAPAWPGWSRGASSVAAAIDALANYGDRYRNVAALAGLASEFPSTPTFDIVEEVPGTGTTSFWGISFVAADRSPRTWRLQFLLRHTAYHVMDHAWEMEDKDLTTAGSG